MGIARREEIAEALALLAQRIALRESPFQQLEWPREVTNDGLSDFHLYREEIPPLLRAKYVEYVRMAIREGIRERFGLYDRSSFVQRFPNLDAAAKDVHQFLDEKKHRWMPYIADTRREQLGFKVGELIRKTFRDRGYKSVRGGPCPGIKWFLRKDEGAELLIGADRGSLRTFTSFCVGLPKLDAMIDFGDFFFVGQSAFEHVPRAEKIGSIDGQPRRIITLIDPTPKDVAAMTDRAIDLAEWLFPYVAEAIKAN